MVYEVLEWEMETNKPRAVERSWETDRRGHLCVERFIELVCVPQFEYPKKSHPPYLFLFRQFIHFKPGYVDAPTRLRSAFKRTDKSQPTK